MRTVSVKVGIPIADALYSRDSGLPRSREIIILKQDLRSKSEHIIDDASQEEL